MTEKIKVWTYKDGRVWEYDSIRYTPDTDGYNVRGEAGLLAMMNARELKRYWEYRKKEAEEVKKQKETEEKLAERKKKAMAMVATVAA